MWLQIVRIGDNFAAYRSTDGVDWSRIHEWSGEHYLAKGPVLVGFFVGGGETPVTATFDSVSVKTPPEPLVAYRTSWLGNSLSGNSQGHVSGLTNAFFVSPDGKCYANAAFEEACQTAQVYKDATVLNPIGRAYNNGAHEGSITANSTHTYLYAQYCDSYHGLVQADVLGAYGSFRPMFTTTPLAAAGDQSCHVSGLATCGDELYVSDNYTNQILVLKIPYMPYAHGAGDTNVVTRKAIDTAGVDDPAPQEVYQSQRYGYIAYDFTGLDPEKSYKVRLHFAELKPENQKVGKHYFQTGCLGKTNQILNNYDPAAKGGKYKASVVAFNNVHCDGEGKLSVEATPSRDTGDHDTRGAVNGIEILNPDGTPRLRLNCGGSAIPGTDWKGESPEIPQRDFSFNRPGPIAVDKRGLLWIVQEGRDYPASANFEFKPGWAAVKCYDKYGAGQNKAITDLRTPPQFVTTRAQDRLLVAENGPDQNIRIYTGLTTTPKCTSTFGAKGGVFSGKTPGVMYDANAGGWARFYGPTGVGVDAAGNTYVASNLGPLHTDIRAFKPDGSLLWKLQALEFCNIGDFDASVDASDLWTTDKHYRMDWRIAQAGRRMVVVFGH